MNSDLEALLEIALQRFEFVRIDAALEGVWSESVRSLYTPDGGWVGASVDDLSHEDFQPSIELYFDGLWLGRPAFQRRDGINVFDDREAREIAAYLAGRAGR